MLFPTKTDVNLELLDLVDVSTLKSGSYYTCKSPKLCLSINIFSENILGNLISSNFETEDFKEWIELG
jgi:hypothetical protein